MRGMGRYVFEVSTRYNWGCMRGIEQYVLRSISGITEGA